MIIRYALPGLYQSGRDEFRCFYDIRPDNNGSGFTDSSVIIQLLHPEIELGLPEIFGKGYSFVFHVFANLRMTGVGKCLLNISLVEGPGSFNRICSNMGTS